MYDSEVKEAVAAAHRFIAAAIKWEARVTRDAQASISGTREAGAMKRASLDLSMALSQMRKPFRKRTLEERRR